MTFFIHIALLQSRVILHPRGHHVCIIRFAGIVHELPWMPRPTDQQLSDAIVSERGLDGHKYQRLTRIQEM